MIKLSDYVMKFVAGRGVKHVFMLAGGGAMHLVDSLGKSEDLEYICSLHEQAASIAADAYGQYTNNLGVALVTTGPGGTNAITGVAASWIDSTPTLIISGQVKRDDLKGRDGPRQRGVQEVDIISIVRPITKYAETVQDPMAIRYHLEHALHLAKTGRPGPVWIDIPLDVQATMIDEEKLPGFKPSRDTHTTRGIAGETIVRVLDLINRSERPVILAGNGIRLASARSSFMELIELLQVPVLTTWRTMDFMDENHPLYAGRPGAIGQRGANFTQQNSDLMISLGARLDFGQTAYNHTNFAKHAKKVIIDADQNEIEKLKMQIDLPIICDAGDFIAGLINNSDLVKPVNRSAWIGRCREWKEKYPVVSPDYYEQGDKVNVYVLVDVLSHLLTGDDVIVPGSSGSCIEIFFQAFMVKYGQRIFSTPGLGSMGFGIAAAIGACVASGGRRTICINGDGGFQLNIQELQTISRLGLPVKFFYINNGGYGSIMITQKSYFEGRFCGSEPGSGLTLPEISRVSEAYGIRTRLVSGHSDIDESIRDFLEESGPGICEVLASPDQIILPRAKSIIGEDGRMMTLPMEDLWPFLPREEFFENMIVAPCEESRMLDQGQIGSRL